MHQHCIIWCITTVKLHLVELEHNCVTLPFKVGGAGNYDLTVLTDCVFHVAGEHTHSAADDVWAGASTSATCSLCQAGTYWTGSGSKPSGAVAEPSLPVHPAGPRSLTRLRLRQSVGEGPCTQTCARSHSIVGCLACTDAWPCLQEPLAQAPAACVSPGPTRLAQVWCGTGFRCTHQGWNGFEL